jgi:hypothetical protein
MDKIFGTDYKKLDKIVSKFKNYDLFKLLLNEYYSGFDDMMELYEDIISAEGMYERSIGKYKNLLIQKCFKSVPCKMMKLGELVEIKRGKSLPKAKMIKGTYPVITGTKNIFIGSLAGSSISSGSSANTTGLNSVLIGYDVRPLANGDRNEIVISGFDGTAGTVGLGSNTTLIGSSTTTTAPFSTTARASNSTAASSSW